MKKSPSTAKTIFVVLLVCGFCAYALFQGKMAFSHRHNNDFKHIYLGAEVLKNGGDPYDPNTLFLFAQKHNIRSLNPYFYPPFRGAVLIPLTFLSFPKASVCWFVVNHALLWLGILFIFLALELRLNLRNLAFAFLLTGFSFPLYRTLTAGQLNLVLLFLYSLILDPIIKNPYNDYFLLTLYPYGDIIPLNR